MWEDPCFSKPINWLPCHQHTHAESQHQESQADRGPETCFCAQSTDQNSGKFSSNLIVFTITYSQRVRIDPTKSIHGRIIKQVSGQAAFHTAIHYQMSINTPRMRSSTTYLSLFLLPISALQIPSILAPFYQPYTESSTLLSNESLSTEHELLKRDGNCPVNFNSCTTFRDSAGGACCTAGSFCTTDKANNIACCPAGATCTGSLGIATATTTGGAVFGKSVV